MQGSNYVKRVEKVTRAKLSSGDCDACHMRYWVGESCRTWPHPCTLPDHDEVMKAKIVLDQMFGYWHEEL